MRAGIGFALLFIWLLLFLAFHITVAIIHLLPIIAIVLIIMHFAGRNRAAA
jgi:hypothetical protein